MRNADLPPRSIRRSQSIDTICASRVIGIIRATSTDEAVTVGEALVSGGLRVIEVALTTPGGLAAIGALAERTNALVGAGTVLDSETARQAVGAGARFLVSPGLDEGVIREAARLDVACLPGVATATEVMRARALDADLVKLFPASVYGIDHLRALRTVFPSVAFVPTGGVGPGNIANWLAAGAAAVGVGGTLTAGGHDNVARRARDLLAILHGPIAE